MIESRNEYCQGTSVIRWWINLDSVRSRRRATASIHNICNLLRLGPICLALPRKKGDDRMSKTKAGLQSGWLMLLLLVFMSVPAASQYRDNLGGNWNNPASATITNIIMDRMAQRRLKARLAAKHSGPSATAPATSTGAPKSNDASLRFRSTGTHLKTREIANLMAAGNAQVLNLLTALLEEYEKNARAAGKPNDLALALSFFFATNASIYHDAGQPTDPQMLE